MRSKYIHIALITMVSWITMSCEHKDLCYLHNEHAHRYHIRVNADYRCVWEET